MKELRGVKMLEHVGEININKIKGSSLELEEDVVIKSPHGYQDAGNNANPICHPNPEGVTYC